MIVNDSNPRDQISRNCTFHVLFMRLATFHLQKLLSTTRGITSDTIGGDSQTFICYVTRNLCFNIWRVCRFYVTFYGNGVQIYISWWNSKFSTAQVLPIAKTNTRNVLPRYQDKFGDMGWNRLWIIPHIYSMHVGWDYKYKNFQSSLYSRYLFFSH